MYVLHICKVSLLQIPLTLLSAVSHLMQQYNNRPSVCNKGIVSHMVQMTTRIHSALPLWNNGFFDTDGTMLNKCYVFDLFRLSVSFQKIL